MALEMASSPTFEDRKTLATDCFKRGAAAMKMQNWEYACEMLRQSVNLAPDDLLYRQALRAATERRYQNNGTGIAMAEMRLTGTKSTIKKNRLLCDWNSVLFSCEDGLALNPWDAALQANLGDAAYVMGWLDIAIWSYEGAVKQDRFNEAYTNTLLKMVEERGD